MFVSLVGGGVERSFDLLSRAQEIGYKVEKYHGIVNIHL